MGMSLEQVLNEAGYDVNTKEGATWFMAQLNQFEELMTHAEDLLEDIEEKEYQNRLLEEEE